MTTPNTLPEMDMDGKVGRYKDIDARPEADKTEPLTSVHLIAALHPTDDTSSKNASDLLDHDLHVTSLEYYRILLV